MLGNVKYNTDTFTAPLLRIARFLGPTDHAEFEAEVLEARQPLKRAVRTYHSVPIKGCYPAAYGQGSKR